MDEDNQVFERTATDLVRYALACHAAGKPIKRENLKTHVFSNTHTRNTRPLFDRANALLASSFGLHMVALPSHEKVLTATKAAPIAATKWVLQSTLPDAARQSLELAQSDEQRAILGFAAMVLSLVFVSNMSVGIDQLVLYVRKLGPPPCITPIDRDASDAQMESAAREAIAYLARHGYLDKVKLGEHSDTQPTQATQLPEGDLDGMMYTWGPQAKVEFQPLDMARFIAAATGQECSEAFLKTIGRAYGSDITAGS
ncbi:hypothetical protein H4S07_000664 [Coemansia furcata]|uniref:Uncharacterized protein n=1 Tax=Coemansia furcata TaxID=417177 RepID=A0ACC1LQU3_9FUNG|nr:hypothetical protein H4S07_000664 [Coemansia furcata]